MRRPSVISQRTTGLASELTLTGEIKRHMFSPLFCRRSAAVGIKDVAVAPCVAGPSSATSRPLADVCLHNGASLMRPLFEHPRRRVAGDHGVQTPSGRSLAPRHQAAGTEASACMAANEGYRQPLPAVSTHPAPVAGTTVSRQSSEVGARCGSTARRDLCGGRPAMAVPTATAPNGISVQRWWSLSKPHLKEAVHGQVYPEFVDCRAGWSGSGQESLLGSRGRREGPDRGSAQAHAQPAHPVLRRAAVRSGDGGVLLGASLGRALIELGHEFRLLPLAHVKPYVILRSRRRVG